MGRLKDIKTDKPAIKRLEYDHEVIHDIEDIVERALGFAKAIAPRDTGRYAASLDTETVGNTVSLYATDFKAWWIEFGAYGRKHPFTAKRTLRTACALAGIKMSQVMK